MTFFEFEQEITERITERFKDEGKVKVTDVHKNNGTVFRGITIWFEGKTIFPTLYIDNMYEEYMEGISIDEIYERAVKTFEDTKDTEFIDIGFLDDYVEVKKRLFCKLINCDRNNRLLNEVPHIHYLDMAIVFYVIAINGDEQGTIIVNNQMAERFNVTAEEMLEVAKENNRMLLKVTLKSIEDLLSGLYEIKMPKEQKQAVSLMYVLTNEKCIDGAACILDENTLKLFSEEIGSDFYIIPSSIHEVILVPDYDRVDSYELKKMVKEVNDTQVAPKDILSDSLYVYKREFNRLEVVG